MENASKALIMAAGVFLAMLVLGSLIFMWRTVGGYTSEIEGKKKTEQITSFNKQYESYLGRILRGNDISSIINRTRNNNTKDTPNKVVWEFILSDSVELDSTIILPAGVYSETQNINHYNNMIKDPVKADEFTQLYFVCTKIEYNSETGYVNKITFLQKGIKQIS